MAQRQPTHYYEKEGVYLYILDGKRFYTSCAPDDVVFKRINGEWIFWEKCIQGGGSPPPPPPATKIGTLTLTTDDSATEGDTKSASVSNDGDASSLGYKWQVTGGTITSGDGTSAIQIEWGSAGAGSVKATVTSSDGFCDDSPQVATENVTVNFKPTSIGNVTLDGPQNPTEGDSASYTAQNDGDASGLTYSWSASGAGEISGDANKKTVDVNLTSSGTLSLTVVITSSDPNCSDSPKTSPHNIPVAFPPEFIGNVTVAGDATATVGEEKTYSASFDGNIQKPIYRWKDVTGATKKGGGGLDDDFITVEFNSAGTSTVGVEMDSDDWMVADRGAEGSIDVLVGVIVVHTEDGDSLETEDGQSVDLE